MKSFSYRDRIQNIQKLKDQEFDLFIVGGGINGAGIARDAVLRGMRVGLVEADDFASGTSSRSSKLIHGGIRYLENLEFGLVFEALRERSILFDMAPHLVHPLRFLIPVYKSSRVSMTKLGLGMWLYDALALFRAPKLHERLAPADVINEEPLVGAKDLRGAFIYSDAFMDDDRLVIETLRSAHHHGAVVANFARAGQLKKGPDGKWASLEVVDQMSGDQFSVRAKHFISSVGPWTDIFGEQSERSWQRALRPTKGVHLTFARDRLPIKTAVVMAMEERIVFAIPRNEMVILGTTDTDFSGDPSGVVAEVDDVKYLLSVANFYFPMAQLTARDILSSYAGVRPLLRDDAESEGKTSREHRIWSTDLGLTFVAGGKYTTYRLIAEQAVEEALQFFSIEDRARFNRSESTQPLNPLIKSESWGQFAALKERLSEEMDLDSRDLDFLLRRHGEETLNICRAYGRKRNYLQYEAMHALHSGMCLRLVDFYARRVPLFLADPDHGLSSLDELALIFKSELGWTEEHTEQEKKLVRDQLEKELSWRHSFVNSLD